MVADFSLPKTRGTNASFHLYAGTQWLDSSDEGRYANALVYCSFEFRVAIERVAFELLIGVRAGQLDEADLRTLNKFRNIQKRIYELEGHQLEIDRKVEFANTMLALAFPTFPDPR